MLIKDLVFLLESNTFIDLFNLEILPKFGKMKLSINSKKNFATGP